MTWGERLVPRANSDSEQLVIPSASWGLCIREDTARVHAANRQGIGDAQSRLQQFENGSLRQDFKRDDGDAVPVPVVC